MSQLHIATQDDLPGPDGDEPYVLFVNQTELPNSKFLQRNVLSARPDLKRFTSLRFRQAVKAHPAEGEERSVVLVFMDALGLEPPLTLISLDLHLEMEGLPIEDGRIVEFSLVPPRPASGWPRR